MSLLIKGMEMPKSCADCKLRIAVGCCGNLPHNTRMPNCPLVPVPLHGRLGDLDNFALLVLNWISSQEKARPHEDSNALAWRLGAKAMANQIYRDAKAYPSIIPAEAALENEIKIIDTKGKPNYDPKHRFVIPAEEGE